MTTLLALYRRPEGGPEPLAEFERRYAAEHLPLVAGTPGLREAHVHRVAGALGGETDLVLITAMRFDDRAALDAGLASNAMRAAGRNLRGRSRRASRRCSCSKTPTTSPAEARALRHAHLGSRRPRAIIRGRDGAWPTRTGDDPGARSSRRTSAQAT